MKLRAEINLRNTNHIVHQKIALMQMRQAVLLCYLQALRQFLITYQTSGIRRTSAYDANNQPLGINIPGAGSVAYNQYQWTRPQSGNDGVRMMGSGLEI